MAGFKVIRDKDNGALRDLPTSSLTAAIGDLLEITAGSTTWVKTTSSTNFFTRKAIVQETATAASLVLCYEITGHETVVADSTNASAVADNGDRMALTDENAVNNSGTDVTGQAVAFVQDTTTGATSDNLIIGRILVGNGVDPDAA